MVQTRLMYHRFQSTILMGFVGQGRSRRRKSCTCWLPHTSSAYVGCGAGAKHAQIDLWEFVTVEANAPDMQPFLARLTVRSLALSRMAKTSITYHRIMSSSSVSVTWHTQRVLSVVRAVLGVTKSGSVIVVGDIFIYVFWPLP